MLAVVLAILALLLIYSIWTINTLVAKRQQVTNAWGQIDVQLKRRYDLIPNLVETVKGYMTHEQSTLEKVIAARSHAADATGVKAKAEAESEVSSAIGGLLALSESYPELRASESMGKLQDELSSTENKISFARQYYNDSVTAYNTMLESFPSSLLATMGGFKPREMFELYDAEQREPVAVKF